MFPSKPWINLINRERFLGFYIYAAECKKWGETDCIELSIIGHNKQCPNWKLVRWSILECAIHKKLPVLSSTEINPL